VRREMELKFENAENIESFPIFLSKKFLRTQSDTFGWIVGYIHGEKRVILPYFIYKKASFRLLRFTHQTYFLDNSLKDIYEQIFLDMVVQKVRELNIDTIMQPTTNVVFDRVPKDSIYAPFGTYRVNLKEDEEVLWGNLHARQRYRAKIKKAQKEGVEIVIDDYDIDEVHQIMSSTFGRSSMSFMSLDSLKNQIETLGSNVRVFVAKTKSSRVEGVLIIPFDQKRAYYSHGGSVDKPIAGTMNYLHWSAMIYFKNLGLEEYDFVGARINPPKGSKLEGIQLFKKRFGATLHQGYMWKYPIRPIKSRLFNSIYKIIRNSDGDIIDQEMRV
jgi:lipid II:glycine glycyltransferase (peptidoglycan interpeptide bridge formation enzyme)